MHNVGNIVIMIHRYFEIKYVTLATSNMLYNGLII